MRRKNKDKTVKITSVFTEKQIELIDREVLKGILGSTRAEIVRQIVLFYLKEHQQLFF